MTTIYLVTTHVRTENEENAYAEPFLDKDDAISYFIEEADYYKDMYPNLYLNFDIEDIDWKTINQNNSLYLTASYYNNLDEFYSIIFRVIDR